MLLLLLLAVGTTAYTCDKKAGDDFDFFVFVEQSPGALCSIAGKTQNCTGRNTPNWTIHGLWPSRNDSYSCQCPQSCNTSYTFNIEEIELLKSKLDSMWPSLKQPDTDWNESCSDLPGNQFIWCHEWEKHGTCANQIPDLNTERKFFSGVLQLFVEKMNYDTHVLAKHGIVPSTTQPYPVDRIVDAFQSEWHVHPVLQCYPQRKGYRQRQILTSIRTCLNKQFEPIDCPYCVFHERSCYHGDELYYYPTHD